MNKVLLFFVISLVFYSCQNKESQDKNEYDLIPVKLGDKWGYINKEGNYVINPQYKYAGFFSDEVAIVANQDSLFGYINKKGEYLIQPTYKGVTSFEDGIALVVPVNGFISAIDQKNQIKFVLKDVLKASGFSEGLAVVKQNNLYGFIDKAGTFVIKPQFGYARDFKEGLAVVLDPKNKGNGNGLGFIDKTGKIVIKYQFSLTGDFSEGVAFATNDYKLYGYIDKNGNFVINPQFTEAKDFKNGLASILQGSQWGYISKDGKIVTNPQFDYSRNYNNSFAAVSTNSRFGFIDKEGKMKINPQFDDAFEFLGDIAPIKQGDKFGFINKKGEYVINPQFDDVQGCNFYQVDQTVIRDFYDSTPVISKLFPGKVGILNITRNSGVKDVIKHLLVETIAEVKNLGDSGFDMTIDDGFKLGSDEVKITNMKVRFFGEMFLETPTYSEFSDGTRYRTGTSRQIDNETKISYFELKLSLTGNAVGKSKNIATAIRNELMKRFNLTPLNTGIPNKISVSNGNDYLDIEYHDYSIKISYEFSYAE